MGRDIGDVIAGSILRHAALFLFTGGVGNIVAAAADVFDVMDVLDASDAYDAYDASSASSSPGGDGQVHFGSSQDVNTTQGPGYTDDHGNTYTYPTSGTDTSKLVSPNDVLKK